MLIFLGDIAFETPICKRVDKGECSAKHFFWKESLLNIFSRAQGVFCFTRPFSPPCGPRVETGALGT